MPDVMATMETKLPVRLRPSVDPIDTDQLQNRRSSEPVNDQRPVLYDPWESVSRGTERTPLPRERSDSSSNGNTSGSGEQSPDRSDGISRTSEASRTPSPRSKGPSQRREHTGQHGQETHQQQGSRVPQHLQQPSRTASLPAPQHQRMKPAPQPIMLPGLGPRLPPPCDWVGDVPNQTDRRWRPVSRSNPVSGPAVNSPTGYSTFTPVQMYPVNFNYQYAVAHVPMSYLTRHAPMPPTPAQAHAQARFEARAKSQARGQAKGQSQAQMQAKAQTRAQAHGQAQVQMGERPLTQPQAQVQAQAQVQKERAQTHAQAQSQVQAQLQVQEKAQTQDQGQAQSTSAPHDRETLQEVASPVVSQTVTDRQARPELREDLWRVGSMFLCNPASADAFVKAVEIRHSHSFVGLGALSPIPSTASPEPDQMQIDTPRLNQQDNPYGNELHLRVVIHLHNQKLLVRQRPFERDKLRETMPDFMNSPRTPLSVSSAAPSTPASAVTVTSTPSFARRRKSYMRAQFVASPSTPTTPSSAGSTRSRLSMPPVPIRKSTDDESIMLLPVKSIDIMHAGLVKNGTVSRKLT